MQSTTLIFWAFLGFDRALRLDRDRNGDGDVNCLDLIELLLAFGLTCP